MAQLKYRDPADGQWKPVPVGGSGGGHQILDEGTALPPQTSLNFVGAGVTTTNDTTNNRTVVTIPGGAGTGTGGHTIMDEAVTLPPQTRLAFLGAGVTATDDPANTRTVVTIPGATGAGTTILSGTSVPTGSTGAVGNYYLDTDDKILYGPKVGTTWPIALRAHVIREEGTALAARTGLNFIGPAVTATDDLANDATKVTISTPPILVLGPTDPVPVGAATGTVVIRWTTWNGTTWTADTSVVQPPPATGYGVPAGTVLTTLTAANNPNGANTITTNVYKIKGSQTLTGWRFRHRVEIDTTNPAGVTVNFVNCRFEGAPGDTTSGSKALLLNPSSVSVTVNATRCTFDPASPYNSIDGIRGHRLNLDGCEITRTIDGGQLYGSGNCSIIDSWIHDLIWYDDGSHPDGSHNDGFQITVGSDILIDNCLFDGEMYNAAIYAQQASGAVVNLTISNNTFNTEYHDADINIYDGQQTFPVKGLHLTGNKFRRTPYPSQFQMLVSGSTIDWDAAHGAANPNTFTGNAWIDGSSPRQPSTGVRDSILVSDTG